MSVVIIGSIVAALVVGILVLVLYNKLVVARYATGGVHTQHVLHQVMQETRNLGKKQDELAETLDILKADISRSPALQFLSFLPYGKQVVIKIVRAGKQESAGLFLTMLAVLGVGILYLISQYDLSGWFVLAAVAVPLWFGHAILKSSIQKRNNEFINMFPDVLDMIVRSVRSGFPINSAITMVAENMEDPVRSEFRQVADELILGRPLSETLSRLVTRIDEQDIRFFVVVLKIQQETGGNLREIISNLSSVIRKRKQLRLKIRAITSEGRITGYILSAIPIFMSAAIFYTAPEHLEPLFTMREGNYVLAAAIGLIVVCQIVVRKMVQIDI
jgi:Flp pilus assembly protein TadB